MYLLTGQFITISRVVYMPIIYVVINAVENGEGSGILVVKILQPKKRRYFLDVNFGRSGPSIINRKC